MYLGHTHPLTLKIKKISKFEFDSIINLSLSYKHKVKFEVLIVFLQNFSDVKSNCEKCIFKDKVGFETLFLET